MPIDVPAALAAAREAVATLAAEREQLLTSSPVRPPRSRFAAIDTALAGLVDLLGLDPCDASPAVPLVLLPVRVETRLGDGGRTLRVRITPDEIHVDTLQRRLSDEERAAGRAHWTTLWQDAGDVQAWPALVAAVGERRAAWVAYATRPLNRHAPRDEAPVFGDDPPAAAGGSVVRCLPDRFVVRVHPHGHAPVTVHGKPVPPDLPIAPIALSNDELVDAGGLKVPAGSAWTVDFDEAERVGLGVVVPLPPGVDLIDCVVVTGVRQSVSEASNAADLTQLLAGHRHADGLGLLAFGTPTNNASTERSPYRPDQPAPPPGLEPPPPSADTAEMAALLGIEPAALDDLLGPASPRSTLGPTQKAANTALWYATWSAVLDRVEDSGTPGATPATIESARRLHRESVRGAGHCPALRVGAQPYGILPVTALAAWKPRHGETTAPVAPLVQRLLARWVARSRTLPHVGPDDDVTDDDLLEMMGTQPSCTGVRVRPAVDGPKCAALAAATGAAPALLAAERQVGMAILGRRRSATARGWSACRSCRSETPR